MALCSKAQNWDLFILGSAAVSLCNLRPGYSPLNATAYPFVKYMVHVTMVV